MQRRRLRAADLRRRRPRCLRVARIRDFITLLVERISRVELSNRFAAR
jgi:hypothetical protein